MKFTKFQITNYKGIQNLTLDFEKQPISKIVTLVGLNESGKTSILEAINFLTNGINSTDAHKLIPKKHKLSFSSTVSVKGFLIVNAEDNTQIAKKAKEFGITQIKPIKDIAITRQLKFDNSQFTEESNFWSIAVDVKIGDSDKFVSIDAKTPEWQKLIAFLRDEMIPKILFYSNFSFDFPNKIYLEKDYSKEKNQEHFRDVIQDILTSIDKTLTIEDHIVKRINDKSESAKESLDHTLSMMSSQISKVVLGAWKNIMNIKGKEILVDAKSETINTIVKAQDGKLIPSKKIVHYLEFRLKERTEKYFISERSMGFKWFFTFLLFTEFRKNRKTDIGETLFLLDEPASNLHSTAQKKLLDKFEDLLEKGRLIYTTHSHHLINPKWLSGTYVVKNEAINYKDEFEFDSRATNVTAILYKNFVSKNPKQQDYFQPILDALEYQPGLLEKIPSIIITEGKFDYYTFRYLNEVVMNKKYKALNLYPGNGADANEQIIRLYLAWGRDFIILLDGDKGGEKAKTRYLKLFGESIYDNIITYNNIDSKLSFPTESLFSEKDRLKITKLFDENSTSFDKSKFNCSIQNLFSTKTKQTLEASTLLNFTNVFNHLDNYLNRHSR